MRSWLHRTPQSRVSLIGDREASGTLYLITGRVDAATNSHPHCCRGQITVHVADNGSFLCSHSGGPSFMYKVTLLKNKTKKQQQTCKKIKIGMKCKYVCLIKQPLFLICINSLAQLWACGHWKWPLCSLTQTDKENIHSLAWKEKKKNVILPPSRHKKRHQNRSVGVYSCARLWRASAAIISRSDAPWTGARHLRSIVYYNQASLRFRCRLLGLKRSGTRWDPAGPHRRPSLHNPW